MNQANSHKSPHKIRTSAYDVQAQLLILNVLHFFREAENNPTLLQGGATVVSARALNISRTTIFHIEQRQTQVGQVENPRKKINQRNSKSFDSFDIAALKNVVKGFYADK
jgi:hypothetical protein